MGSEGWNGKVSCGEGKSKAYVQTSNQRDYTSKIYISMCSSNFSRHGNSISPKATKHSRNIKTNMISCIDGPETVCHCLTFYGLDGMFLLTLEIYLEKFRFKLVQKIFIPNASFFFFNRT